MQLQVLAGQRVHWTLCHLSLVNNRTTEHATQIVGFAAVGAAAQQEDFGSSHEARSAQEPISHSSAHPQQAHAHIARRSQRQQQQRQQLQQKQIEAEKAHTARLSAGQSRAGTVTNNTNRLKPRSTVSRAKNTTSSAVVEPSVFSDENQQTVARQQNSAVGSLATPGKAAEGKSPTGRKGKSSPTAGVKKQTSPAGKGGSAGLGLGNRFPLRVRKNAQQHVKGPLDGKLGQASQNRGLGDLAAHMPPVHTQ